MEVEKCKAVAMYTCTALAVMNTYSTYIACHWLCSVYS